VIFHPKNPSISTTKYSFTSGEVIKNEKVTPRGTPDLIKLRKIGIEEQEQNGVIAPKVDATMLLAPNLFLLSQLRTFIGEIYVLKNPTIAMKTNSISNIFTVSERKKLRLFIACEAGSRPASPYIIQSILA
jgi:hypothetical protein